MTRVFMDVGEAAIEAEGGSRWGGGSEGGMALTKAGKHALKAVRLMSCRELHARTYRTKR